MLELSELFIIFEKVKTHCEMKANEYVDQTAKQAIIRWYIDVL